MNKIFVFSSALFAANIYCLALAQPPPLPRPVKITPLIKEFQAKGYIPEHTVELQKIIPGTFEIPKIDNDALPANDSELVKFNTFVIMTKNEDEHAQLSKEIPINELREWEKIRTVHDSLFIPRIGIIPGDPPAGEPTSEKSSIIINPDNSEPEEPNNNEEFRFNDEGEITYPESIVGTDNRSRVSPTTSYPWRAIGLVGDHCSGSLIGPRHVLTAAHCVYNKKTDHWYSDLQFTPGRNGSIIPYAPVPWSRVIAKKGYTHAHNNNYDWAMIVLANPIGNTVGWLGYGYNYAKPRVNLNTAGYPGDKPFGTQWWTYCAKTWLNYPFSMFRFKCDIWGGQSGSPMWVYIAPNYRSVRGIVTYHSNAGHFVSENESNWGNVINSYVFHTLKRWKSENP